MKKWIIKILIVFLLFPITIFFGGCDTGINTTTSNKTYTVMFHTNSPITYDLDNQEVKHGGYVVEPKRPTTFEWTDPQTGIKYICSFVGWYKGYDLKDENLWNFKSSVVTEDMTLVAKWDYIVQS